MDEQVEELSGAQEESVSVPDAKSLVDTLRDVHPALLLLTLILLLSLPSLLSWLQQQFSGKRGRSGIRRGVQNALLIVGPSGSGKTCLFYKLLRDEVPNTLTSMKEGEEKLPSGKVLVDFPGHIRVRANLDAWIDRAVAFVMVIDASNPRSGPREGAEFLFELLTDARLEAGPPILVACNKSDVVGAKAPDKIRVAMEREIEELRKTRAAKADVMTEAEGGSDKLPLGRPGIKFKLEEDCPCSVSFASCSVTEGKVDEVLAFVEEHVGSLS